jgi:hypothetical protein
VNSQQIADFSSVSIKGAFNYGRARVLWNNGLLRVYTVDGLRLEILARRPVKRPRHLRTWDIDTGKGDIVLRGKCITCGGRPWWRIAFMPVNELWRVTA